MQTLTLDGQTYYRTTDAVQEALDEIHRKGRGYLCVTGPCTEPTGEVAIMLPSIRIDVDGDIDAQVRDGLEERTRWLHAIRNSIPAG